jgi:hypothetical protein
MNSGAAPAAEGSIAAGAVRQGRVEGAELFLSGRAERLVEAVADGVGGAVVFEGRVGPPDSQVEVDQGDAVGGVVEDGGGLVQGAERIDDGGVAEVGDEQVEALARQGVETLGPGGGPDGRLGEASSVMG